MAQQIITYLTFNGNCKEAMTFYQSCLGGELDIKSLRNCPHAEHLPEKMRDSVVEAVLKKQNMVLMASDMADEKLLQGNSVSILLECKHEKQAKAYYNSLSQGGYCSHPLTKTDLGGLFGCLKDRFGFYWLLHSKG